MRNARERAPDFILVNQNGCDIRLSNYLGQAVVLYFFPKDDIYGSIIEACSFRDAVHAYREQRVAIIGISSSTKDYHQMLHGKYGLPFDLLSDKNYIVAKAYGTQNKKKSFGTTIQRHKRMLRTTFLLGDDGIIEQVFKNVDPKGHADDVFSSISGLCMTAEWQAI